MMGQLIAFRPREPSGAASEQGAAEILFFTGVRYQRHDAEPSSSAPDPKAPEERSGRGRLGRRRRRG
jgi:hypothetical protein